ncbi:hypothetical protein ABPG75_008604 [Micractinium tetrahymenae]
MSTRGKGKRAPQALEELQASIDAQLQQLEGRLASEEKAIKNRSLEFSNRIFGAAQGAFERCEIINQEVDEQRDRAEAEHAAKRAALGARRMKLEKHLRETTAALTELRSVQEEAGQLIADLRSRVIQVPAGRSASRQRQQSSLLRPATTGAAAASKQRSAGGIRSGPAGAGETVVAAAQKRTAPVQQAQQGQQAQQKKAASGTSGAKKGGQGQVPGKLVALGKHKAAAEPGAQAEPAGAPADAAPAAAEAAPARHVTWDKSPQA